MGSLVGGRQRVNERLLVVEEENENFECWDLGDKDDDEGRKKRVF